MDTVFFNAHHSPIGAFASFTLGCKGASGGLGLELAGPANQNVYIGMESQQGKFQILPFFAESEDYRKNFATEGIRENEPVDKKIYAFGDHEISRDFHLSTDKWIAGDLAFTIFSPVNNIPDPSGASDEELKKVLIPAVFAEITVDNTRCTKARKAFFGFEGNDPYSSMRHIQGKHSGGIIGIGQGCLYAICTNSKESVPGLAFSAEELLWPQNEGSLEFGLGKAGAILLTAAPKKKTTWKFAICFYRGGPVTVGKDASYYYTRFFNSIEEIASYGLSHFDEYKQMAIDSNRMIDETNLPEEKKFMMSHAIRSYYGSTELLNLKNAPFWIVNEGEYRMINTLDLTVDHLFYEIKMNRWTVRNVLDSFLRYYSYIDVLQIPGGNRTFPGGISFTHDMGVANTFSPEYHSAYELPGLNGVFSYMTQEELVNWVLCAGVYFKISGDLEWVQKNSDTFTECLKSLLNRDHFDPGLRDGIMDLDTGRALGGAEITTYDNVDNALGRARRSTYLAVKCWAAYIALENIFTALNFSGSVQCREQAKRCVSTILGYKKPDGTIPAILEEGNESVAIPIIEGLVFTWFIDRKQVSFDGRWADFIKTLKTHCETVLSRKDCLFDDGGWRLSSTSDNSWLSKIYLSQFICGEILGIHLDATADRAHIGWLLDPENSCFAWSDQMYNGKVCGCRYYPRGVTSVLWLKMRAVLSG